MLVIDVSASDLKGMAACEPSNPDLASAVDTRDKRDVFAVGRDGRHLLHAHCVGDPLETRRGRDGGIRRWAEPPVTRHGTERGCGNQCNGRQRHAQRATSRIAPGPAGGR
jgi:hypothetical protein